MARKPADFNPSNYTPLGGTTRRYQLKGTNTTVSRRDFNDWRASEGLITRRSKQFRQSVRLGVRKSRERAIELRRLADIAEADAEAWREYAAELGYVDYTPADIDFQTYTPVDLKKLARERKANIRAFQRAGKFRTVRVTRDRKAFDKAIKDIGEVNTPEKRARLRDLLERSGRRDNVPHWVPPGFSDPNKRPKWWRASNVPRKYKMSLQ